MKEKMTLPAYQNLSLLVTELKNLDAEYQKDKKDISNKFESSFNDFMEQFFELVPQVKKVVWEQYTPSFNDGDLCSFTLNAAQFSNFLSDSDFEFWSEEDIAEHKQPEQNNQWTEESYSLRNFVKYGLTKEQYEMIESVSNLIYSNEAFMEAMYGNNSRVTITLDGASTSYYEQY